MTISNSIQFDLCAIPIDSRRLIQSQQEKNSSFYFVHSTVFGIKLIFVNRFFFIIDCAHIEIAESIYIASITCTDTINIHTNKYNKKQEIRDLNMDSISCELNIQTFISKLNCFLTRAQQRSHQYMKIALIP